MRLSTKSKDFTIAPEGVTTARLVDVIELPGFETNFGVRDAVKLVFAFPGDDGELYWASSLCTASLHKKSRLRPIVEALVKRKLGDDEEVDLEDLIGEHALVKVEHSERGEKTFANVTQVMETRDNPEFSTAGYTRVRDREVA